MKNSVYWLTCGIFIVLGMSVLAPAVISGKSLSEIQFAVFTVACAVIFLCGLKILVSAWERVLLKNYPQEAVHPHKNSPW